MVHSNAPELPIAAAAGLFALITATTREGLRRSR
jgi:hypothetical protein